MVNKLNNKISVKHALIALPINGILFFAGLYLYLLVGFSSQAGRFSAVLLGIIWFLTLLIPIFGLSAVIGGYVNAIAGKNYKWKQAILVSFIVTIPTFQITC